MTLLYNDNKDTYIFMKIYSQLRKTSKITICKVDTEITDIACRDVDEKSQ